MSISQVRKMRRRLVKEFVVTFPGKRESLILAWYHWVPNKWFFDDWLRSGAGT